MHFLKDRGFVLASSEITPRAVYEGRRALLKQLALGGAGIALSSWAAREALAQAAGIAKPGKLPALSAGRNTASGGMTMEKLTPHPDVTSYNNSYDLDELLKLAPLEERIYRLRCVEGWSMVVPWIGYSMAELIKRVEPAPGAKYIEFVTLADPKTMPYVGSRVLDWPYLEGLRLDEAMHPLALLTFGLYGEVLPNQNGAPVRAIVP